MNHEEILKQVEKYITECTIKNMKLLPVLKHKGKIIDHAKYEIIKLFLDSLVQDYDFISEPTKKHFWQDDIRLSEVEFFREQLGIIGKFLKQYCLALFADDINEKLNQLKAIYGSFWVEQFVITLEKWSTKLEIVHNNQNAESTNSEDFKFDKMLNHDAKIFAMLAAMSVIDYVCEPLKYNKFQTTQNINNLISDFFELKIFEDNKLFHKILNEYQRPRSNYNLDPTAFINNVALIAKNIHFYFIAAQRYENLFKWSAEDKKFIEGKLENFILNLRTQENKTKPQDLFFEKNRKALSKFIYTLHVLQSSKFFENYKWKMQPSQPARCLELMLNGWVKFDAVNPFEERMLHHIIDIVHNSINVPALKWEKYQQTNRLANLPQANNLGLQALQQSEIMGVDEVDGPWLQESNQDEATQTQPKTVITMRF